MKRALSFCFFLFDLEAQVAHAGLGLKNHSVAENDPDLISTSQVLGLQVWATRLVYEALGKHSSK